MSNFSDLLNKHRGYESFKEKEKEVEQKMEEAQKNKVFRFWMKGGTDAKVIFLDDDPPIIEEHQIKMNGRYDNFFTCRKILGESCIICDELNDKPYTVGFYTVLDLREYTNKKGEQVKNTIKLFAPKFKALQMIKRYSQKRGGLGLWVCDISRSSAEAFNVGDTFDFEEQTTWDAVKQLNADAEVLDYASLLAPKTNDELAKLLKTNTENNVDIGEDEDDVAF